MSILSEIAAIATAISLIKGDKKKKDIRFLRRRIDRLKKRYKKDGLTEKETEALEDLEDKYLEKLNEF